MGSYFEYWLLHAWSHNLQYMSEVHVQLQVCIIYDIGRQKFIIYMHNTVMSPPFVNARFESYLW